jgi:hypothetical protein
MEINEKLKILNEAAKINLSKRKPEMVLKSLDKLYVLSLKESSDNGYILCKKYMHCIEWLEKQHFDKETVDKYFPSEKVRCISILFLNS